MFKGNTLILFQAAYRDNTLGLPRICPVDSIGQIDRSALYTYLHHHHTPERMVLTGVGVEHQALVKVANQFFTNNPPSWQTDQSTKIDKAFKIDKSVSQYTGGIHVVS